MTGNFARLIAVLFLPSSLYAQTIATDSLYIDTAQVRSSLHFGFSVGSNTSLFYAHSSPFIQLPMTRGTGYRLGLLAEYAIAPRFALQGNADMSVNNSTMLVSDDEGVKYETTMSPVVLNFSALGLLRFAGSSEDKRSAYLIAGPSYRLPVKSENLPQRIYGNSADFCANIGVGMELRLKSFTFAPELRYTHGFSDIDKSPFISSAYHHQISFSLVFKD